MNRPSPLAGPVSVAVLGAGALGSYVGALLARAGHAVHLIGRGEHVAAIRRDGLAILEPDHEWRVAPTAGTDVAAVAGAQIVVVAVKTPDTSAAIAAAAPSLRSDALLVSVQNGVVNPQRIAAIVPQPVYAAVAYIGALAEGPGRIRHNGGSEVVVGAPRALQHRSEAVADTDFLVALLRQAQLDARASPDIDAALWTKLAINCAFNAVSALGDSPYEIMARTPEVRALMEDTLREAVAVAAADGIRLDLPDLVQSCWQVAARLAHQYSSMAQDLRRARRTETDALNGFVAMRGAALGVPTPANAALHALIRLREATTHARCLGTSRHPPEA